MQLSKLYVNSMITTRGVRMIDMDRLKRMVDAATHAETMKILQECGYDDTLISEGASVDILLHHERKKALNGFLEQCSDKALKTVTLKQYDYHNAKVLYKNRFYKLDSEVALYDFGALDTKFLTDCIQDKNYTKLPKPMSNAFLALDSLPQDLSFSRNIDILLDIAYHTDAAAHIRRIRDKNIKKYLAYQADIINMMTAIRCRMARFDPEEVEPQLVSGGRLSINKVLKLSTMTPEEVQKEMATTPYSKFVEYAIEAHQKKAGLSNLEIYADTFLLSLLEPFSNHIFSHTPLYWYYVKKNEELKLVKFVLVCKNNGIPKQQILDKLKVFHGN